MTAIEMAVKISSGSWTRLIHNAHIAIEIVIILPLAACNIIILK